MKRALTNKEVLKTLKQIKKNQENIAKKMDEVIKNQNTMEDSVDAVTTAATKKSWLKQFVEDSDLDVLTAVTGAGSTIAGGIGLTSYVINENLDESQKQNLVEKTRTDYVTIEHLDNQYINDRFLSKI